MISLRRFRRNDHEPAVLVLAAAGLGDLCTAAPALRAIDRQFGGLPLLLAEDRNLAGLARRIVPRLRVLDPKGSLDPHAPVAMAIDLCGHGPESHRRLLATEPECLLAFRHPNVWEAPDAPTWKTDEHEVARWARLLASADIACMRSDLRLDPPGDVRRDPSLTVIHPGASEGSRRWPAQRWARVAASEAGAGRRVVISGTASEGHLAARVATLAGLPSDVVLAGRTDVDDLVRLIAGSGLFASTDTGPARLATALGVPSVTLFGSTPPSRSGPVIDTDIHTVLWHGAPDDPHTPCLASISAAEVIIAASGVRQAVAS